MTEQQKKEIEKIWGEEILEEEILHFHYSSDYLNNDVYFNLTTKHYYVTGDEFTASLHIKINQTLKVLGWM